MKRWILCGLLSVYPLALAQQPAQKYAFEVASIKVPDASDPNQVRMMVSRDPGMVHYSNLALRDLIRIAYDVKIYQIEGPEWIDSTRFDVQAKLPAGVADSHVPEMMQTMLAERFGLVVHRETKDHAILALTSPKGTAKLKPAENPTADGGPSEPQQRGGAMRVEIDDVGAHVKASSVTLSALAEMISRFSDKPIMDMSGIEGQYDFDLVLSPQALRAGRGGANAPSDGAGDGAGSIYDALSRYGLKLDPRKAAMVTIVVDHMEKAPTQN
jgi:uncharacterized protein (TIGR03435 family)